MEKVGLLKDFEVPMLGEKLAEIDETKDDNETGMFASNSLQIKEVTNKQ